LASEFRKSPLCSFSRVEYSSWSGNTKVIYKSIPLHVSILRLIILTILKTNYSNSITDVEVNDWILDFLTYEENDSTRFLAWSVIASSSQIESSYESDETLLRSSKRIWRVTDHALLVMSVRSSAELILKSINYIFRWNISDIFHILEFLRKHRFLFYRSFEMNKSVWNNKLKKYQLKLNRWQWMQVSANNDEAE
jgi:hypothetical protein